MGLNGTLFDTEFPAPSAYTPRNFELSSPKDRDAQLAITAFTVKSGLEAAYANSRDFDFADIMAQYFNTTYLTDDIGAFIP